MFPPSPHSSLPAARALLSAGLAFVFLWFGIDKLLLPIYWIGWIPMWMEGLGNLSRGVWLEMIGLLEAGIGFGFGLGVIVQRTTIQRVTCAIAIAHLLAVLTQTGLTDVGVRDVGLLFATLAIFIL